MRCACGWVAGMPDRPVKLTFPGCEPGNFRVEADGVYVGHILQDHRGDWRAHLWRVAGRPGEGFADEVQGGKLAPLREQLRTRAEAEGPWWTA